MENYKSIYCINCKKHTGNSPKLSAVLDGKRVCKNCSRMNGVYTLVKKNDDNFIKTSNKVKWIVYDAIGRYKESLDVVEEGTSLLMSPFNDNFTWMTTMIDNILKKDDFSIEFETNNSIYTLYLPIE